MRRMRDVQGVSRIQHFQQVVVPFFIGFVSDGFFHALVSAYVDTAEFHGDIAGVGQRHGSFDIGAGGDALDGHFSAGQRQLGGGLVAVNGEFHMAVIGREGVFYGIFAYPVIEYADVANDLAGVQVFLGSDDGIIEGG